MSVKFKLLHHFIRDTFGGERYHPVFYGKTKLTKPFALVVKRPRCIWKRPFARRELKILDGLEKYLKLDTVQPFLDSVKTKLTHEDVAELSNVEKAGYSHKKGQLSVGESVEGTYERKCDFGVLELGKVTQEYITDPDLRSILAETSLDFKKVKCLQEAELMLITSVVSSEKFEVHGEVKRGESLSVTCSPVLRRKFPSFLNAKIAAGYREDKIPPGMSIRNAPGPILFKCCRLHIDLNTGELGIPPGEFVGKSNAIPRGGMEVEDEESWDEIGIDLDADETDLPEFFTPGDIEKLETIRKDVLMTESSREERKARIKRYRTWFEQALLTKKQKDQKVILDEDHLTTEDCQFLRSINVSAKPNQTVLDLTSLTKYVIQGYGIVLKTLEDLPDEEWTAFEKTFPEDRN